MKKDWFVVRWRKIGKRRTNTSARAFTESRAMELVEVANTHFDRAKHWMVPLEEVLIDELKGETSG